MIRLRVFGALDLRDSEGRALRQVLAQPKRIALLVYLALARPGEGHRRDTLLALFWPEQDTEHARNALSQAVYFLRRSLADTALVSDEGDTLCLDRSGFWCDALAFQEALDAGNPAEALELHRGELLAGFHVTGVPGFERWLDGERERLGSRLANAVDAVATEREKARDYPGALALWRRLAVRDPYDSAVALRLLRAMALSGDRAGAMKHARVHELLLREELDVALPVELTAFIGELQTAPAAARVSPAAPAAQPVQADVARPEPPAEGSTGRPGTRRRVAVVVAGLVAISAILFGRSVVGHGLSRSSVSPIRSIAVLPFVDLSGDSARQSLADGLHDAVIAELARYPELSVTSRTSVIQYKRTTKRLPEIARELKADGIVEGTIQREGGRVRVTSQLLHGPTDTHLWSERFTRDLRDVLTLQEDLAAAIARQVHVVTLPSRRVSRARARPAEVELHLRELYLRGRHAELSRSPVGVQTAKEAYERAVREDSTFAPGYAALSGLYSIIARYGYAATAPARDSARIMARRAVALDDRLAEAHTALAITLADALDFEAAEREFQVAIDLSPSDAQAHFWYAMLLVVLGRGPDALREARRALELDPFPSRGMILTLRSAEYVATGERPFMKEPAGTRWTAFLKAEPGEPWAFRANAFDLAEAGKCVDARRQIARTTELAPDATATLVAVAMVEWWCGDRAAARALLAQAKRRAQPGANGVHVANAHATWGDIDSAFVWLNRTEWNLSNLMDLRGGRWLDPVRPDPRYAALWRRLGAPAAAQN